MPLLLLLLLNLIIILSYYFHITFHYDMQWLCKEVTKVRNVSFIAKILAIDTDIHAAHCLLIWQVVVALHDLVSPAHQGVTTQ